MDETMGRRPKGSPRSTDMDVDIGASLALYAVIAVVVIAILGVIWLVRRRR